jgi:Ca2+-binding EF-hand superfamily protein
MIGAALAQLYSKPQSSADDGDSTRAREFAIHENSDGTIDPAEIAKFFERRPDVELYVGMGRASSARERTPRSGSSDIRVRKKIDGGYKLTSPDAEITLRRNNRNPNQQATDQIRVSSYDADNNGYLEKNEVENVPFLKDAFDTIDADGDKKIFPMELRDFVERQSSGAGARLLLEVFDQAQDLFGLLDTDQDGILSPRELRSAENVLASDDKNHDGELGGSEIPQQISLVLSRGAATDNQMMVVRSRTRSSPNRSARTGPTWFQKMDRNYDGDVSPDEFLGPREKFAQLDADHDGFIDADEAKAAGKE